MEKHSPLPWSISNTGSTSIRGVDGKTFILCWQSVPANRRLPSADEAAANAALIIKAVNCHYDLVEALEAVMSSYILCTGAHQETPEMKLARTLVGLALDRVRG